MKTQGTVLRASLQVDDPCELLRRLVESQPAFAALPEKVLANSDERIEVSSAWLREGIAKFEADLTVTWREASDAEPDAPRAPRVAAQRDRHGGGSALVHLRGGWTVPCIVENACALGVWRAVFDKFFWSSQTWRVRRSFDAPHVDLGWGCMLIGERGHESLVSRRWLEFGPWWLRRFPGDVSLVQFHDLDADAETAFAQGNPGHKRISDHDIGGWLRSSYRPGSSIEGKNIPEFRAVYVPDDRSLRVVCAPGRVVSQREMLDACAERLVAKYNAEQPARALRYVFIDPADAEKHLHELWLRDIEVWAIVGGNEVRLDDTYHPTPDPPAWVRDAQSRGDQ